MTPLSFGGALSSPSYDLLNNMRYRSRNTFSANIEAVFKLSTISLLLGPLTGSSFEVSLDMVYSHKKYDFTRIDIIHPVMRKYLVSCPSETIDLSDSKQPEPKEWNLIKSSELFTRLNECKSLLDEPYQSNAKLFETCTRQLEPSFQLVGIFRSKYKIQFVTNASVKLMEILLSMRIVDQLPDTINLFDNGSLPGAWLTASNYIISTLYRKKMNWHASSLIPSRNNKALYDTYGLMSSNKEKYTMFGDRGEQLYNGDVTNPNYIRHVQQICKRSIDLYLSDASPGVGNDFNREEEICARVHLGHTLLGFATLRPGGIFIVKTYTILSSLSMSILCAISASFNEVTIVKPITSKADNSEIYIVGTGYKGCPEWLFDVMMNKLSEPPTSVEGDRKEPVCEFDEPLINIASLPPMFVEHMCDINERLVQAQCEKIKLNLAEYKLMTSNNNNKPSDKFIREHIDKKISDVLDMARFIPMKTSDYLKANTSESSHSQDVRKSSFANKKKR